MKLRNKLILSCAALAAVATTAVSTTFAWYTSNTEVTATGIKAKTATNGDDTLLISLTGAKGTWGTTVNVNANQNLIPLALGAAGNGKASTEANAADDFTLYAWDPENNTTSSTASAEDGNFLQFSLFFKNQSASTATGIYVNELTITNVTETPKAKDILSAADPDTNLYAGFTGLKTDKASTYTVDLLRATDVLIRTKKVTGSANTDDDDYATNATGKTFEKVALLDTEYYHKSTEFNDIFDATTKTGANKGTNEYASAGNAHTYYNSVKGLTGQAAIPTTNPLKTSSIVASSGTKLNLGTTTAATGDVTGNKDIFEVEFTIFLNGWDLHCFDGVQAQNISMSLGFSTKDTNAVQFGTESAK